MKKFLSTILAVVMVLSSMATVAFAAEGEFVYETGKYYVGETPYDSFSAAVSAAEVGGTVIVSGTVEFDSRQGISKDITLEGKNNATIIPSETYGSTTSTTNWKGLLNLAGNITVKNITFDGTRYGSTVSMSTDFVPVRCTSGVIELDNVTISGSKRTLMNVGSSTTSATVTAKALYCDAELKTVNEAISYADVNVVNGTFNIEGGAINGLICTDDDKNTDGTVNAGALGTVTGGHFTLNCHYTKYFIFHEKDDVTSTVKHFVDIYENSKALSSTYANDFLDTVTDEDNKTTVANMVAWAESNSSAEVKNGFGNMLLDAADYADEGSDTETLLIGYAARLGVTKEA